MIRRTTSPYPASDFITVSDAAFAVKADATYDADFLTDAITASIQRAEEWCERSFINSTWTMTLRKFPKVTKKNPMGALFLPKGYVSSITSLDYYDETGASQSLVEDTDFYTTSGNDYAMLVPTESSGGWPETYDYRVNAVTIVYVAGWGATLPTDKTHIERACLVDIGTQYQVRQGLTPQPIYENDYWKMLLHPSKIYFDFTINEE